MVRRKGKEILINTDLKHKKGVETDIKTDAEADVEMHIMVDAEAERSKRRRTQTGGVNRK